MSDRHEQALYLTEKALDALDHGNNETADELLEQAKSLDPSAVKEVVADLDEADDVDPEEDEEDDLDEEEDEDEDEDEDEEDEVPGIDEEEDEDAMEEEEEE